MDDSNNNENHADPLSSIGIYLSFISNLLYYRFPLRLIGDRPFTIQKRLELVRCAPQSEDALALSLGLLHEVKHVISCEFVRGEYEPGEV
ncbi:MAG: hypothetical protein ACMG6E_08230 [Candidatus Roizmanbacteria bacterium]